MKILLMIIFIVPGIARAQDFLTFLSSKAALSSIDIEGDLMPMSDVENGKDRSQVSSRSLNMSHKMATQNKDAVTIGARWQKLDFSNRDSQLRDFYSSQASVAYQHLVSDEKFWSASFSYGSASDRPYENGRDSTIGFNYLQKFNARWFGVLNYSNNRSFLNNIPLPGFFYVQKLGREEAFVVGFPLIYWMKPVGESFSIKYFGIMPWSHRLKLLYTKWRFLRPYGGFEQFPQSYFRHDRENRRDRIFWFERKVMLGFETEINKEIRCDFSGGLAFDRQLYEAKNFSEDKNYLLNFNNAYFIGLSLRYSF